MTWLKSPDLGMCVDFNWNSADTPGGKALKRENNRKYEDKWNDVSKAVKSSRFVSM